MSYKKNNYKRGFDRLNPDTMGVCSYVEATQTFSVAVKGGEPNFKFMSNGNAYVDLRRKLIFNA